MLRLIILHTLFVFLTFPLTWAQSAHPSFSEVDLGVGYNIPHFSAFPETRAPLQLAYSFNTVQTDSLQAWKSYYGFPITGLSLYVTDYGNPKEMGYSLSLLPHFTFRTKKRLYNTSQFKFGLGGSYFNVKYEWPDNQDNWAIGSHFTWTFLARYGYYLKISDHLIASIGASLYHSSNSHTQLPNFGLNTVLVNASLQMYSSKKTDFEAIEKLQYHKKPNRDYYLHGYVGYGFHELGDAAMPKFGPKYPIYTSAIFGSVVYNRSFRLKAGVTYRFYDSYYTYIKDHELDPYNNAPVSSASNIYLSVGGELLLGHIGAEVEIGLNLFKPFYKEFSDIFEKDKDETAYTIASLLPIRLGLKAYAINTNKAPRNNVFVGTHVNTNGGAADFMSFNLGYVRKL